MRSVRAKVGGGTNTTLMEHLRRWNEEKRMAEAASGKGVSDEFIHALQAEFGRVTQQIKGRLEAELTNERDRVEEALALMVEAEKENTALREKAAEQERLNKQSIAALEKRNAGLEALLESEKERVAALTDQIGLAQKGQHAAEIEAAVAKERCGSLEKELEKLKQVASPKKQ